MKNLRFLFICVVIGAVMGFVSVCGGLISLGALQLSDSEPAIIALWAVIWLLLTIVCCRSVYRGMYLDPPSRP